MKRTLAAAALVILAAIVSIFLLTDGDPPAFGYADILYTDESSAYLLEPVEGDVEYFDTVTLRLGAWLGVLEITAAADAPTFSIGSSEWTRSHRDTSVVALNTPQGYVEVEKDGELVRISEIPYPNPSPDPVWHALGEIPFVEQCTLNNPYNPDLSTVRYAFHAETGDAGDSYITLYFRKCSVEPIPVDPAGWRTYPRGECLYTTGDELHSATFRLSLPKESRSKYDVVAVPIQLYHRENYDMCSFSLYLRANDGHELPYLDLESLKVERETEDGLVELFDEDGGSALRYDLPYGMEEVRYLTPEVDIGIFASEQVAFFDSFYFSVSPEERDSADEYTATLEFTENPDGSGERFALRLRLEFPEG